MRVLVVDGSDRGGIARYVDHLVAELRVTGVTVALAGGGGRSSGAPTLHSGRWGHEVDREPRWRRYLRRGVEIPRTAASVLRAVAAVRPDIVHVQTPLVRRLDQLLLRVIRRRAPVVLTVHNAVAHEHAGAEAAIEAQRWRAADALVVHDDIARSIVEKAAPRIPVYVVPVDLIGGPTGIERGTARLELGLGSTVPLALMLGLIRPYKGIDLIAQAWPAVREAIPDAVLAVAGSLPATFPAWDRLRELGGVVVDTRWLTDRETDLWAASADVCLLPYHHGAHSGVLHRAVANGTPVIAAPCLAAEARRHRAGPVVETVPASWTSAIVGALREGLPIPQGPPPGESARLTLEVYAAVLESAGRPASKRKAAAAFGNDPSSRSPLTPSPPS